jgi:hypothetical protein
MMSSSASKSELPTLGFGLLPNGTSPPAFKSVQPSARRKETGGLPY